MKRKTYRNFLIVRNKLIKYKGYDKQEASNIAHLIFENYELDSNHTINEYYDRVLSKKEFELQKGATI